MPLENFDSGRQRHETLANNPSLTDTTSAGSVFASPITNLAIPPAQPALTASGFPSGADDAPASPPWPLSSNLDAHAGNSMSNWNPISIAKAEFEHPSQPEIAGNQPPPSGQVCCFKKHPSKQSSFPMAGCNESLCQKKYCRSRLDTPSFQPTGRKWRRGNHQSPWPSNKSLRQSKFPAHSL